MDEYTVSKLAERVGSTPDTLRYYGRLGLLPAAGRTASGYRIYGEDSVARMLFIKGAQRLGLRLEEISELLRIRQTGLCPCGRTRQLLDEKLVQLDAEVAELLNLRAEIKQMLDQEPSADDAGCACGLPLIQITTKGGAR